MYVFCCSTRWFTLGFRIQHYYFSTTTFFLLHTYNSIIWDHKTRHNKHGWSWWKKRIRARPLSWMPHLGHRIDFDIFSYYTDVIISTMAPHITSVSVVCSAVYSGAYQRKHRSPASLALVMRIHRWPVDSPHKGPVTRKRFPLLDVIMLSTETIMMKLETKRDGKRNEEKMKKKISIIKTRNKDLDQSTSH